MTETEKIKELETRISTLEAEIRVAVRSFRLLREAIESQQSVINAMAEEIIALKDRPRIIVP